MQSREAAPVFDAVVIGAGMSGLSAADSLRRRGHSVCVVEARDRVGGRVHDTVVEGCPVELGGAFAAPVHTRLLALAERVGVGTFPAYIDLDDLIVWDGQVRRGEAAGFSRETEMALEEAVAALEAIGKQVPPREPWLGDPETDTVSFGTWLESVADQDAQRLIRFTLESLLSAPAYALSLLHVAWRVVQEGGFYRFASLQAATDEVRFVEGPAEICRRLADSLPDVRLSWPVRRIEHDLKQVRVSGEAGEVLARKVIVALPPTLTSRLTYSPPLSGVRDQLTQRVPQGSAMKTVVIYSKPFWRDDGLSGLSLNPQGPISSTMEGNPADGSLGVLVCFSEGDLGRQMMLESPESRKRKVIDQLTVQFGNQATEFIHYVEMSWMDEEYTRGCYMGHFPPGVLTRFGHTLIEPIGPIHWAGAETASEHLGYMDGAIEAGERAADEVDGSLRAAPAAKVTA